MSAYVCGICHSRDEDFTATADDHGAELMRAHLADRHPGEWVES